MEDQNDRDEIQQFQNEMIPITNWKGSEMSNKDEIQGMSKERYREEVQSEDDGFGEHYDDQMVVYEKKYGAALQDLLKQQDSSRSQLRSVKKESPRNN